MNWRQGWIAAGIALSVPGLGSFASNAGTLPGQRAPAGQESNRNACFSADFAESRKLMKPLEDFIELRRTMGDSVTQIVIHRSPEGEVGVIVRQTKPDGRTGDGTEDLTSTHWRGAEDVIRKIWEKSDEITVPAWPISSSGLVHFQFYSLMMMNSTCFEWSENGVGDPPESDLPRFAREVFTQLAPEAVAAPRP